MLKSVLYKSLKDTSLKITPTCFGSYVIHHQWAVTCTLTEITCNGSQIFIMCVVGVRRHIWDLWCVCVCMRARTHTHTHHMFRICCQTLTMHMINISEPLQVISVKVQVITPWWWILCDPKHVGVIFNYEYVSFKLLYNIDFNVYVLYNLVH